MSSVVIRGDDPRLFGPGKRVRASKLFPLPESYTTPGLRVVPGEDPAFDALYEQLSELLGRPDALDPESDTARAIADVEAALTKLERVEAEQLRARFEDGLLLPLTAGADFERKLADALSDDRDRPADHPASDG